jgi:predicted N-formylglutamate amidohydrolase
VTVFEGEDDHTIVARYGANAGVLITCEHASQRLPLGWRWSERDQRLLGTHWAYDLFAAELAREYAERIQGVAILANFSRLLADPNRPPDSPTLFRSEAEGLPIELNEDVSEEDRDARMTHYYRRFHAVVDREVARSSAPVLFAMHTFTPVYEGQRRELEVGVLFDDEHELAEQLRAAFAAAGYRVALNEPYSGRAGLIYVAHRHATKHGRKAIELEVRQDLAAEPSFRARLLDVLAATLR